MSLKSLLTFNGYVDKVNNFEDRNSGLEKSSLAVFDIVKDTNMEDIKARGVYQGHQPPDIKANALGEDIMPLDEILAKGEKLETAMKDGWIYDWDTETFGVTDEQLAEEIAKSKIANHPGINSSNIKTIQEANARGHIMTELYMTKQRYMNGEPVKMVNGEWVPGKDRIEVFRITNAKKIEDMKFLASVAQTEPGAGALMFNLERAAGSYGDDIYGSKHATYPNMHNPNGDIFNADAVHGGIINTVDHAQYIHGTPEFNKAGKQVLDEFLKVVNSDNSVLESLNGDKFDLPVIFNYFKQAGINIDEATKNKIRENHVDTQRLISATGFNEVIYEDLNTRKNQLIAQSIALYKSGNDEQAKTLEEEAQSITLGITNEHIAVAANSRGAKIKPGSLHVAREDVGIMADGLDVYRMPLLERINELKEASEKKVGSSTSTLYTANRAVMFDGKSDIFFSNTIGPDANTYNSVGMESGHTYKLNVYNLGKLDTDLFKAAGIEDMANKKLLEMEDQYENFDGTRRKSYLVVDSDKEIQSRILDTGNVSTRPESKMSPQVIKETTENALIDKARLEKSNWFNVNSDKGFKSFEDYLGIFEDFRKGMKEKGIGTLFEKDKIIETLSSFNSPEDKAMLKQLVPGLFSTKKGQEDKMIQERVINFANLYDDINANYDSYKLLRDTVNEKAGTVREFSERVGIDNIKEGYFEHNKIKTAMLYEAKNNLDDEIIEHEVDKDKIIERYYQENQTATMDNKVQKYADALRQESNASSSDRLATARKDLFEHNFKFEFNTSDQEIREMILGYTAVKEDAKSMSQLDIIGEGGKYTRIRTDNAKNIESDLDSLLNIDSIKNKAIGSKKMAREQYIKNVAYDLSRRGIINSNDYDKLISNTSINPYQKTTLLSGMIHKNRLEVESIAKEASGVNRNNFAENVLGGINYGNITKGDIEYKKNKLTEYVNNLHMNVIKRPENNIETYLGMNKSALINKHTDNGRLSKELIDNISKGLEDVIPESFNSSPNAAQSEKVRQVMVNEFGWTKNNADLLIDNVINNPANDAFTYAGSGKKVKGGVTTLIKKIGDEGYLISAPKDRQLRIEQMLLEQKRYGYDLDELKKVAMVYKLDKVDTKDGIREIRSSNASAKAITESLVSSKKKGIMTYEIKDTIDESLIAFKRQYELGLKQMSLGNIDKANSIVNTSRRVINENKSRSSTVITQGEHGYIKNQKLNVSDSMLNNKLDISDIVSTFDTVLEGENNPLRNSLNEAIGESSVNRLLDKVATYHAKPYRANKLEFGNLDVGAKLWFALNTEQIADKLLGNGKFMENADGMESVLKLMKEHGASLFLSKESGEASNGILNKIPTHSYVAGSYYSGASRPLINQVLNSKPITEADMLSLANDNKTLGMGVKNIEELIDSEHLNIKFGRSFATDNFLKVETASASASLKGHQGFSAVMKYMDAKEWADSTNRVIGLTGEEDWAVRIMAEHDVTENEIKRIAEGIGNVTSIYEDSGAIDPSLARVFEQRGVTVEEVKNVDKYIVGGTYKGKEIIGVDGNKLHLQNKEKYFDVKVAFGYGEKAELHAFNAQSVKDLAVASAIFKEITGGASVVLNPSLVKHDAFNSMFTLYSNAITNNISNNSDAQKVNDIFKKFMPDHEYKVEMHNNRYVLREGNRKVNANFDAFKAFENIIDKVKGVNTDIKNSINTIEKEGKGFADFSLMSDNTIERPFEQTNEFERRGGAKINYRSQQAMGIFIGDDPLTEISKYRTSINGKSENVLQSLIDSDIEQLMKNDGFVKDMKQASNIGAALLFSELHGNTKGLKAKTKDVELYKLYKDISNKAKVVDLDLEQAVTRMTQIDGENIPQAFSMFNKVDGKKEIVNAYKIKLDNVKLINPAYADLESINPITKELVYKNTLKNKTVEEFARDNGIKKYVDEIYIPALNSNRLPGGGRRILTDVQKSAADLINALHQIKSGDYGDMSLNKMKDRANDLFESYQNSLRYEITDKNGFYKSNLNIRSENSARFKMANIAAPVVDKNGQYLNTYFKDRATKLVDGKVQYRSVQVVNASDLFGDKVDKSFTNIGKQLIEENVANDKELFGFLKKNKYAEGNTLEEMKAYLKANGNDGTFRNMGKEYLEQVGFNSLIMRDPAMLSTSYQTARTYVSNQITKGSTWIDAVSAKWMNADGDGDEINGFYHMLENRKKEGFKLRSNASKEAEALLTDINNRTNVNQAKFNELVSETANEETRRANKAARTLKGYFEQVSKIRESDFTDGGIINQDYIFGRTKVGNLLSRFLKGSIGQVSNPNYYLKAATSYYAGSRDNSVSSLKLQKNIQTMTDVTEQSLIDVKSIKGLEEANSIARLASSYRLNMDTLGMVGDKFKDDKFKAMTQMINDVGDLLVKKGHAEVDDELFGNSDKAILARNEMAERILSGKAIRNDSKTTVEEILADAYKVLQDEMANKVFFDAAVRQTDLTIKGRERIPMFERNKRALSGIGIGESVAGRGKIFQEANALNYMQHAPIVDNQILSIGDVIKSSNIDNNTTPGVFKVHSFFTDKDGNASLVLDDLSNDSNRSRFSISGRNFDNVSKNLDGFKVLNKHANVNEVMQETHDKLFNKYSNKATSSLEGAAQVFNPHESNSVMNNEALEEVDKVYNKERVEEFLSDVEIIKNNKYASDKELTNFRKNMNEALKNKGTADYRSTRKSEMLKFNRVSEGLKVSPGTFDKWSDSKFNNETRQAARDNYFFERDVQTIMNNSRYNLDELKSHLNKTFDNLLKSEEFNKLDLETMSELKQTGINNIMNNFRTKDENSLKEIQGIFAKNMSNKTFKEKVLNMNLAKAVDIGETQTAMNMLGETVISYGNYSGYSINQLGATKADEILTQDYMLGVKDGIDQNIKAETEKIIQRMKNLESKDGIIRVNPSEYIPKQLSEEYGNDYIGKLRKEMNESLKARGAKSKESTGNFSANGIFNKAKTAFNELSSGKKKALAAGAVAVSALALMALGSSGEKTLYANEDKYNKENRDEDTVKVKEPQAPQSSYDNIGNNDNVPMSDSRFYSNQNNGLSVNVSGDAPEGAAPGHASNILEAMMGGSKANLNTSFNDSRSKGNDSDVNNMMSNATTY